MKFSEDDKAWKRVGYGAILLVFMPIIVPVALIVIGLYKIGRSWDEFQERLP